MITVVGAAVGSSVGLAVGAAVGLCRKGVDEMKLRSRLERMALPPWGRPWAWQWEWR
jgi:hypothetical protein